MDGAQRAIAAPRRRPGRLGPVVRRNLAGYVFISPWLLGFLVFIIAPIASSLFFSATRYDLLSPPVYNGFRNYAALLRDKVFWKSLTVTLKYVFFSVPLRLIFALAIAVLFNRKAKMLNLYRTIYYLPSIIGGSIAIAVMWRRLFMNDGAINAILSLVGIESEISWIGNPKTALWTIIILAVWQFGSSMLIFLAGLKQIPEVYYEAAAIDGANQWQKFIRITIPQLSPVIFFNLVMQTINGFTVFTQAFVISGSTGDPMNSTLVYALYLYQRAFTYYDMGTACAMAWLLVLLIAAFTGLIFKSSSLWVHYEAKEEGK